MKKNRWVGLFIAGLVTVLFVPTSLIIEKAFDIKIDFLAGSIVTWIVMILWEKE